MILWDSVSLGHNLEAGGGHILLWALHSGATGLWIKQAI